MRFYAKTVLEITPSNIIMPMELKFTLATSKIAGRIVLKTGSRMSLGIILVLAVIQGLAELLPVSVQHMSF